MKTLLLARAFPPQTGGSARWFWELYRRLPSQNVVIAAGQHTLAEEFDRAHAVKVRRLPLGMPQWGLRSVAGLQGYWGLFQALTQLVWHEKVQIVHAGCVLPEGWLAWMLNKRFGLPYLIYVHGEDLNLGVQSRELGWMMRRVIARTARIIVNSRNTHRLLRNSWGVQSEKLSVLHPGVDTGRFVPAPRDAGARWELVLQRPYFVSTSPPQLFATSGLVALLCDAISLHSPVAPGDDLFLVPLSQVE